MTKDRIKPYPKNENTDMSVEYSYEYLVRGEGRHKIYVIPKEWNIYGDEDILVKCNRLNLVCTQNGFTTREWYNRWILKMREWEEPNGPKCPYCGAELQFRGPQFGYRKFCSNKCSREYVNSHPDEYPNYHSYLADGGGWGALHTYKDAYKEYDEFMKAGGGFGKMWRNLDNYPNVKEFLANGGAAGHMLRNIDNYPKYKAMIEHLKESHQIRKYNSSWGKFGEIEIFGRLIKYRSKLEYCFLKWLEKNCGDSVTKLEYENITLPYVIDYCERGYIPDFYIEFSYGLKWLVEVKYHHELDKEINIEKFKVAKKYCEEQGFEFIVFTDWDLSEEEFIDPE